MANPNADLLAALRKFYTNTSPSADATFRAAVDKYLEEYSVNVNKRVRSILAGTSYTNLNTRQKLLNRLAQQTTQVAQRAAAAGVPSPALNTTQKKIKFLLELHKKAFNNLKGQTNVKWNGSLVNLNQYKLINVNAILKSNYSQNDAFTKEVRRVLKITPQPPPLPQKPEVFLLQKYKQQYNKNKRINLTPENKAKLNNLRNKIEEILISNYNTQHSNFASSFRNALGRTYQPPTPVSNDPFASIKPVVVQTPAPPAPPAPNTNQMNKIQRLLQRIYSIYYSPTLRFLPQGWNEGITNLYNKGLLNQALNRTNFSNNAKKKIKGRLARMN